MTKRHRQARTPHEGLARPYAPTRSQALWEEILNALAHGLPDDLEHETSLLAGKRILTFGINYAPEPTGIALNTTWLIERLVDLGCDVDLITGIPHYPSWKPGQAPRRFRAEKLRVLRRPHYVPSRQSAARRGVYEMTWLANALPTLLARKRVDLVLGIIPALASAVLARAAATRYRAPYALLFQDLLGRAAIQSGMPGAQRVAGSIRLVETACARSAARVGIVADGFREYFTGAGIDSSRIIRIRNPARLGHANEDRGSVRARMGWTPEQFVVLHTGSMGYKQGLESVVRAANLARQDRSLLFVFQGDGNQRPALETLSRELQLSNVRFLPLAPEEEFPSILESADAMLLNQRPSVQNMSMPAKLASYFLAGRPTIAAVAQGDEVAREIEQAGGGVVVEPGNPYRLLEAISWLRQDPERAQRLGDAARRFAENFVDADGAFTGIKVFLASALTPQRSNGHGGQLET